MARHPLEKGVGPTCILNGASIHVEVARAHIARISGEFGVPARVIVARSGDELSPLAARAVNEKSQPVVAGGGDGTANAVAGALVGTDTALGVLPMGTLNHFAKDLGIPLGLEAAVRNIRPSHQGGCRRSRIFVNNSGVGLYPHLVRQREEQQRHGHVKWVAIGSVLRRYARLREDAPVSRAIERTGHILCRPILGGLHHQYVRI